MHHVRQEDFGDAVFVAQVHAIFCLIGNVQQHQAGLINLRCAIGHHPAHTLTVRESFAKCAAAHHMLCRKIQSTLRHGDIVHAMPQSAVGEAVLSHVEALALPAKDVFSRYSQVIDFDFRVAAAQLEA